MKSRFVLAITSYLVSADVSSSALFTERLSINPTTGAESDGAIATPHVSADGCTVVFQSSATTLADPKFAITSNSPSQIYAVNRCVTPHTIELVSVTNDGSTASNGTNKFPNVSDDGRYVAFYSNASNLPNGGTANNFGLIFIRDRLAQTTSSPLESWRGLATLYTNNSKPYMSGDATHLALEFVAPSVSHNVYRFDLSTSPPTLQEVCPTAAMTGSGYCENAVISADSSTIVFDTNYAVLSADTNTSNDIYTFQSDTSNWQLASVNADGSVANGDVGFNGSMALSQDGQIAVFHNYNARNLANGAGTILIKELNTGSLSAVNQKGQVVTMDPPTSLSVSANAQRIGFAPDTVYPLVHFQQDALVFDGATQRLVSVCRSSQAEYGDAGCAETSLSADGNWAVFTSFATNLTPGITNATGNVFISAVSPSLDLIFTDSFGPPN